MDYTRASIIQIAMECAVVALFLLFLRWNYGRRERLHRRYRERGIRVEGVVTSIDVPQRFGGPFGEQFWAVGAEYQVDGQYYRTGTERLFKVPDYRIGDAIPVYYMPDDPSDSCILDSDVKYERLFP